MADLTLTLPREGLTPVELRGGIHYKRDDLLAFSNGVSGKVRTTLHLGELARANGAEALVYGGSVHAPALGRVASAAAYLGMDCYLVIGSELRTARRHATVQVCEAAGASFLKAPVAYNPALQKKAREVAAGSDGLIFQVPYGVSTEPDWTRPEVEEFLNQDLGQTDNLPDEVETLVVPFGSANAASGVMWSLASAPRPNLRRVVLMGIGPDKMPWFRTRLGNLGVRLEDMPFEIEHLPLHPHFAEYGDRMPETLDGIRFHPTYEGKMIRYLELVKPEWWTRRDGTTAFWIVGGPLP